MTLILQSPYAQYYAAGALTTSMLMAYQFGVAAADLALGFASLWAFSLIYVYVAGVWRARKHGIITTTEGDRSRDGKSWLADRWPLPLAVSSVFFVVICAPWIFLYAFTFAPRV